MRSAVPAAATSSTYHTPPKDNHACQLHPMDSACRIARSSRPVCSLRAGGSRSDAATGRVLREEDPPGPRRALLQVPQHGEKMQGRPRARQPGRPCSRAATPARPSCPASRTRACSSRRSATRTTTCRCRRASKLPDEQIADLTAWVKMGAPWPDDDGGQGRRPRRRSTSQNASKHWSLPAGAERRRRPRSRTRPGRAIADRSLHPGQAAKQQGLTPAAPADRRTLLRRVHLRPDRPAADAGGDRRVPGRRRRPTRYEKVVDRLLASPHYGERWGRHWLDLVRFAETHGHEFDFEIPDACRYRDYVIRAFNADVPYDRFVIEHIAGDLLPKPRRHPTDGFNESILGTGFWFLGEAKHSPVDVRGDEADRIDNQIDVFGQGVPRPDRRLRPLPRSQVRRRSRPRTTTRWPATCKARGYQQAFIDRPSRRRTIAAAAQVQRDRPRRLATTLRRARSTGKLIDCRRRASAAAIRDRPRASRPDASDVRSCLAVRATGAETQTRRARSQPPAQLHGTGGRPTDAASSRRLRRLQRRRLRRLVRHRRGVRQRPERGRRRLRRRDAASRRAPVDRAGRRRTAASLSDRLQGVLRSPTFTIDKTKHPAIACAGNGGQVNLIVDGFQLIRDPIYGGLTFDDRQRPTPQLARAGRQHVGRPPRVHRDARRRRRLRRARPGRCSPTTRPPPSVPNRLLAANARRRRR